MIRLAISVEGQTEEEFVKELLFDHLWGMGIETTPILIGHAGGFGGGNVTLDRLSTDMTNLYWSDYYVTSLVDFYGFEDKGNRDIKTLETDILNLIDKRIKGSWDRSKVIPYVQRHEFEGLLFSNVDSFDSLLDLDNGILDKLKKIRSQFGTPEDINDDPSTAPSKRLEALVSYYNKPLYGSLLAIEIGLDTIRNECPRFSEWLGKLEALAV